MGTTEAPLSITTCIAASVSSPPSPEEADGLAVWEWEDEVVVAP